MTERLSPQAATTEASILERKIADPENMEATDYQSANEQLETEDRLDLEKSPRVRYQKISDKIAEAEARSAISGDKEQYELLLTIKEHVEGSLKGSGVDILDEHAVDRLEFMVDQMLERNLTSPRLTRLEHSEGEASEEDQIFALMGALNNLVAGRGSQYLERNFPGKEGGFDTSLLSGIEKELAIKTLEKNGYKTQRDLMFDNSPTAGTIRRLGLDKLLPQE